jgi:predicted CoA-binding protein
MMPEGIRDLLEGKKTIAVVGASRDPRKAAHYVPKYLMERGFRIIPVNPQADEVLGERSYRRLSEITESVDIVVVFRPSNEAEAIVSEALRLRPKMIWLQLGITSESAMAIARSNGILYVSDKCLMVEHMRLSRGGH